MVAADKELLEIEEGLEILHVFNLVVLQVEVGEIGRKVQIFYYSNPVVCQIQTLQIDASLQPFNLLNLLIAEIDMGEALQEILILLLLTPPLRSAARDNVNSHPHLMMYTSL